MSRRLSDQLHPLCKNFLSAAQEIGINLNRDMNGKNQEGVGNFQITTHKGQRMSSSRAYLWPIKSRTNLTIIKNALVSRILIKDKKAYGVEYIKSGKIHQVMASCEVILSAGSINSPQLLQLSGVGPKDVLDKAAVSLIHDSPAVGENLQDHLGVSYFYKSKVPTLNDQLRPFLGKIYQGLRYIITRRGPLSLSVNQSGGFIKTRDGLEKPNIQLYFSPVSYSLESPEKRAMMSPDPFSAMLFGISSCSPLSRGRVHIESNNPLKPPIIEPNYLSHKNDIRDLLEGVKVLRKLAKTDSFREVIGEEFRPGQECQTDEANDPAY